ncbi:MAG: hypothetical protein H2184_15845 [Candidatus Galacturonibacter soehngenii]|nr:hypothetical protein [Candidatus Galacturonibacter soehngenii]
MAKKIESSNEFTEVEDIKNDFLYTTYGYVLCYVSIGIMNINLLSDEERATLNRSLTASYKEDKKDFMYCCFPREVNLDKYKEHLSELYRDSDIGRRHILAEAILDANEKSTNGENFEHQHFIKIWRKKDRDIRDTERSLNDRAMDFIDRYQSINIAATRLDTVEIIKLCNLFGNSSIAPFMNIDQNTIYTAIPKVGRR